MISVDTLEDNTAFAKKESADFPLLADPTKETARKYGVLGDFSRFNLGEVANRWIRPGGPVTGADMASGPHRRRMGGSVSRGHRGHPFGISVDHGGQPRLSGAGRD